MRNSAQRQRFVVQQRHFLCRTSRGRCFLGRDALYMLIQKDLTVAAGTQESRESRLNMYILEHEEAPGEPCGETAGDAMGRRKSGKACRDVARNLRKAAKYLDLRATLCDRRENARAEADPR